MKQPPPLKKQKQKKAPLFQAVFVCVDSPLADGVIGEGGGGVVVSVVIAPTHHLLAGGPEQDGVLKLSGVAAPCVTEGGVGVHDAQVAQVLQGHQVLALTQTVQPASAESQRAKVLVDDVQQVLRSGQPEETGSE